MKVSFELQEIKCIKSKRSDQDSVKIFFFVVADNIHADKMESDTESLISNSLENTPYDLTNGKLLDLASHAPIGRPNWKTFDIEFGEATKIKVDLIGIGYHRVELGGGGESPDNFIYNLKDEFLSLFGKPGELVNEGIEFAQKTAASDKDKDCFGGLFRFTRYFNGVDLAFQLLKNQSINLDFAASESEEIDNHKDCRKPQYSAKLKINRKFSLKFVDELLKTEVNRTDPIKISDLPTRWKACIPKEDAFVWMVRSSSQVSINPSFQFSAFRYRWKINDKELSPDLNQCQIQTLVERIVIENNISVHSENKTVRLNYAVSQDGKLSINCPETEGNFGITVTCELVYNDESVKVYNRHFQITSEEYQANQAYEDYLACDTKHSVKDIIERIKTKHHPVPKSYDPSPKYVEFWETLRQIPIFSRNKEDIFEQLKNLDKLDL